MQRQESRFCGQQPKCVDRAGRKCCIPRKGGMCLSCSRASLKSECTALLQDRTLEVKQHGPICWLWRGRTVVSPGQEWRKQASRPPFRASLDSFSALFQEGIRVILRIDYKQSKITETRGRVKRIKRQREMGRSTHPEAFTSATNEPWASPSLGGGGGRCATHSPSLYRWF